MKRVVVSLAVVLGCTPLLAESKELADPVPVEAGGAPIDVEIGHAAPFVGAFDGDGQPDLLVGQFGEGKLRIYRNTGSGGEFRLEDFSWFQAGGETGKVPAG